MHAGLVLDDQLVLRVTEVEPLAPLAAGDAQDEVDLRLGQPSENDEQAYPRLHRRVDISAYEGGGTASTFGIATLIRIGDRHELHRIEVIRLDQAIASDDQVNEADTNTGKIKKGLYGCGDRDSIANRCLCRRTSKVCRDAGPAASRLPACHAQVNVRRVGSHTSPQPYCRVMTYIRRGREPFHYRVRADAQVDHLAGADVGVMEEAGEVGPSRSDTAIPIARALALVRTLDLVMLGVS